MKKETQSLSVRTVQLVTPGLPTMPKRKRVAAYARVSLGTEEMADGTEIVKTWQSKKQGAKEKGLPDQESLPLLPQPSVIPAAWSKLSEDEKERIAELRSMGYEYKRIAAALGRPVSTIRTHCIYRPIWLAGGKNGDTKHRY